MKEHQKEPASASETIPVAGHENNTGSENLNLRQVRLEDIRPGANVREFNDANEIASLGISLRQQQLQPLLLAPDLTLIDGWRRWLAAQKAGLKTLWAVISANPLSNAERIAAQMIMALHRRDLTEIEKVRGCEELAAACPDAEQKQLAERLQVDPATVSRWLCLSGDRVIPPVRDAFFSGKIGLTQAAYPIAQAAYEHQAELLQMALHGATREQISSEARKRKQGRPNVRLERIRCPLAGGASVIVSGTSLGVDELIDVLGAVLREARRARSQNLDIKTLAQIMADRAKVSGS
jgi:ParB/RepB/Spo0J family partition protein